MSRVPKTTPRFDALLGLTGLCIVMLTTMSYYSESTQRKGESARAKSEGNQALAPKSLLPVASHKAHSIPPATSCDNSYEKLSIREAH